MHLSKTNVHQTLVLAWRYSRPGLGSCWRLMTPPQSKPSIDTFVQLASLHFSGLIAIVSAALDICSLMTRFSIHEQITRLVCVEGWSAIA
jgi:hypothetical protein